jgi:hypothetical protein
MNGGCTTSSGPSHLDDCCVLFSGRLDESLERRQSTYSVEKLVCRISGHDFGGLKPSLDQFAWL